MGKALGVAGALALVLIPATILGVIGLALTAEFGALARDLSRGTVLGAVYLVYFATLIGISLGVSLRAKSSRTALIILLALWFGNSLLASRAAADLAAAWYPAPSAVAFHAAMERDLADQTEVERRLQLRREDLLRRYAASSIDAVPINFSGISLQEGEEHANEVFDQHFGRLFAIYEQQNRVQQWAGLAAPLLPMRTLSMSLAGTDFAHHRAFVDAAERHRRMMQRVLNGDLAEHSRPGEVYLAGRELWNRIPDFVYEAPGVSWALATNWVSSTLIAAWLFAAIGFAATGARRPAVD
jgi:ABC-2 type transport system permease protein